MKELEAKIREHYEIPADAPFEEREVKPMPKGGGKKGRKSSKAESKKAEKAAEYDAEAAVEMDEAAAGDADGAEDISDDI